MKIKQRKFNEKKMENMCRQNKKKTPKNQIMTHNYINITNFFCLIHQKKIRLFPLRSNICKILVVPCLYSIYIYGNKNHCVLYSITHSNHVHPDIKTKKKI